MDDIDKLEREAQAASKKILSILKIEKDEAIKEVEKQLKIIEEEHQNKETAIKNWLEKVTSQKQLKKLKYKSEDKEYLSNPC